MKQPRTLVEVVVVVAVDAETANAEGVEMVNAEDAAVEVETEAVTAAVEAIEGLAKTKTASS